MNLSDITGAISKTTGIKVPDSLTKSIEKADEKVDENTRNKTFKKICALIPGKVSNDTVVGAFELMRKNQGLLRANCSGNLAHNEKAFKSHEAAIAKNKGYVEDQNAWTDLKYGVSTMQFSGCEVFATYNAMFALTGKHTITLPKMISEYEKDGMVLSGKFGTSPKAIVQFLKKQGFTAEMVTKEAQFDTLAKTYRTFILTMYNDGSDISQEVHTVSITSSAGQYTAHNVYCNGKVVGPYPSISGLIKNINSGKAKGICLIGIK